MSDTPVTVTSLRGIAVGRISFVPGSFPPPTEVAAGTLSDAVTQVLTVQVNMIQGLFAIGDEAFVFAYATFSDGAIMEVDASMGLTAASTKTDSIIVDANPLRVRVPAGGTNADESIDGDILTVKWESSCNPGVPFAVGTGTVEVEVRVSGSPVLFV